MRINVSIDLKLTKVVIQTLKVVCKRLLEGFPFSHQGLVVPVLPDVLKDDELELDILSVERGVFFSYGDVTLVGAKARNVSLEVDLLNRLNCLDTNTNACKGTHRVVKGIR